MVGAARLRAMQIFVKTLTLRPETAGLRHGGEPSDLKALTGFLPSGLTSEDGTWRKEN